LLGDHDATSLAFRELGVMPRELAVVDVDQRLLEFLGDGYFADLRVGLPAPLRGRFDVVVTDPRTRRPASGCSRRGPSRRWPPTVRRGC
jgi:predicted methyltransferase